VDLDLRFCTSSGFVSSSRTTFDVLAGHCFLESEGMLICINSKVEEKFKTFKKSNVLYIHR
jgi:hypothetical protein